MYHRENRKRGVGSHYPSGLRLFLPRLPVELSTASGKVMALITTAERPMALHIRLMQQEMYLPNVESTPDLMRALGSLKRYCKTQSNIALAIEPFEVSDRGRFSLIVAGTDKPDVETESDHLLNWIETKINGQTLASEISWL